MTNIMVCDLDLMQFSRFTDSMRDQVPPSHVQSNARSDPPHDTLLSALDSAAARGGPFLTFHDGPQRVELDYRGVLEGAGQWASLLVARGVQRGDRIPILMSTSPHFVQALAGVMLAGAIPVPLPFPLTFGGLERYIDNLAPIIEDSGARCFATDARIREVVAHNASLQPLFDEVLTVGDLEAGPCRVPMQTRSVDSKDTALIQYTSGTTGRPKGVVISHRALVANAFAIAHGLHIDSSDVGVSWLPMFHDMGLIGALITATCHPYPVHLMSPASFIMRPYRWLQLLSEVKGTLSPAPNFAYELCVSRRWPEKVEVCLDHWRVALNGSEPVMPVTTSRFTERFAPMGFRPRAMTPVYGLAESTLAVAFSDLGAVVEVLALDRRALESASRTMEVGSQEGTPVVCVGAPVAGTSIRIVDQTAAVVPEHVVGEIEVAGPCLMDGYFRNEAASARALSGGWLRTGDLGCIAGGRLFVIGRASDMIIKGGRNLYPVDIERIAVQALGNRPVAVAAFARPNSSTGTHDLVVAAETTEADPARREAMVKALRGEVLAALGVGIDEVRLVPAGTLPRTTSGKIRRKECARVLAERSLS